MVEIFFVLASSKLTAENVYLNLFSAPAPGHQIISAPPAPPNWIKKFLLLKNIPVYKIKKLMATSEFDL